MKYIGLLLLLYPVKLSFSTLDSKKYSLMGYAGIIVSLMAGLYLLFFPSEYIGGSLDMQPFEKIFRYFFLCLISLLIGYINYLLASYDRNHDFGSIVFPNIVMLLISIFLIILSFFFMELFEIMLIVLLFTIIVTMNIIKDVKGK